MTSLRRISLIIGLSLVSLAFAAEPTGSVKVSKKTPRWQQVEMARFSASEAMAIALKAVPGAVVELELEVDDGALVYEIVVVAKDHSVVELEIDAGTGEILERETDD